MLACLSGTQMGSINEKRNRGQKSRDTVPLTNNICNRLTVFYHQILKKQSGKKVTWVHLHTQ